MLYGMLMNGINLIPTTESAVLQNENHIQGDIKPEHIKK